jgi:phosphatidylserine/phosphatidylglycerophosphate/cardiolipin synthase-like enzyme
MNTHAKKVQIDYVPAQASLDPVTVAATITAHVSPDAGLQTLEGFLAGTRQSLVIGMYDFTSGRILASVQHALRNSGNLKMVLDNPPLTEAKPDQSDTQAVDELNQRLGGRASIARALSRPDAFASEWMFPSAYHIKVVVRDRSAVWLSSGNFNNTNQPDLSSPPPEEDRDWHVIIDNEQLARTFEAFLAQDFDSAAQHQAVPPGSERAATSHAFLKLAAEKNALPPVTMTKPTASAARVKPLTIALDQVRITPLLTPDNDHGDKSKGQYLTNMIDLISKAEKTIYIQLQYIECSTEGTDYDALLKAIAVQARNGLDVRLIENREYGEKWAEKMKSTGVDLTANIWMQPNVHNKGFVIDSRIVVVSSQNFSGEGVRQNRDAGVIIENERIAQYFEAVFLTDLKSKAKKFAPTAAAGASTRNVHARKASAKKSNSRARRGRRTNRTA